MFTFKSVQYMLPKALSRPQSLVVLKRSLITFKQIPRISIKQRSDSILGQRSNIHIYQKRHASDLKAVNINESNNNSEDRSKKIKNVVVLGLMILMPILCFQLGNWQYRRLHWKKELIYKLKDRLNAPPLDVSKLVIPKDKKDFEAFAELEDNLEFTKYRLRGKFVHNEELFVGPRVNDDVKGYFVYTPFIINSEGPNKGKKVMVERGFVSEKNITPQSRFDGKLSDLALPMNEVEIICTLRRKVKPGNLALENEKDIRLLVYADVQDMAKRTDSYPVYFQQLEDMTDKPYRKFSENEDTVSNQKSSSLWKFWSKGSMKQDQSTSDLTSAHNGSQDQEEYHEFTKGQFIRNGVPLGAVPEVSLRNNHLEYMVTWYSLALVSSVLIFFVVRKKKINPLQEKLRHAKRFQ